MTVRELKELLDRLPCDMPIGLGASVGDMAVLSQDGEGEHGLVETEFIDCHAIWDNEKRCWREDYAGDALGGDVRFRILLVL